MLLALWLAEGNGAPAGGAGGQDGNPLTMLLPFILMIGVMYLIVFRPQKKKEAERRKMLEALRKGDLAILRSGILGKVASIRGSTVSVIVDEAGGREVKVRVLRSAIDRIVTQEEVDKAMSGSDGGKEKE